VLANSYNAVAFYINVHYRHSREKDKIVLLSFYAEQNVLMLRYVNIKKRNLLVGVYCLNVE
jgi:hypothetical protein